MIFAPLYNAVYVVRKWMPPEERIQTQSITVQWNAVPLKWDRQAKSLMNAQVLHMILTGGLSTKMGACSRHACNFVVPTLVYRKKTSEAIHQSTSFSTPPPFPTLQTFRNANSDATRADSIPICDHKPQLVRHWSIVLSSVCTET